METEQVLRRNQLYGGGQAAAVRCPRSGARLAARVAESRRNELQASCFAAAFFGANQETLQVYGERLED